MLQPTIVSGNLRAGANGVTQVWTETGRQQSEKIVRGVELPSIWGGAYALPRPGVSRFLKPIFLIDTPRKSTRVTVVLQIIFIPSSELHVDSICRMNFASLLRR